jgi:large subunit ribosomal protein L21e
MVQRRGGFRRKTRYKLSRDPRDRGKVSIRKYLQSFKDGERVILKINPSVHGGMYFPRFHGNHGIIRNKRGECYIVEIKDKDKAKSLIVHPVHLTKV